MHWCKCYLMYFFYLSFFLFCFYSVPGDMAHNWCRLSRAESHPVLGASRSSDRPILLLLHVPSTPPHGPVWGQSAPFLSSCTFIHTQSAVVVLMDFFFNPITIIFSSSKQYKIPWALILLKFWQIDYLLCVQESIIHTCMPNSVVLNTCWNSISDSSDKIWWNCDW